MDSLVPTADRAPSVASRVVSIDVTDITEGAPGNGSVTFALPCDLHVADDDVIIRSGSATVRLVDGKTKIRLPVYGTKATRFDGSDDWGILVRKSWAPDPYMIRVPNGTGEVSLADLPAVRPLTTREQLYAITSVGITVTEGAEATGSIEYHNGVLTLHVVVPSFRPATVYPYIDQQVETMTDGAEAKIRQDLDDRLREVTTAYELAVVEGFEGTIEDWLESLVGPQGDKGDTGDRGPEGPPNILSIGTVEAGDAPDATITGTSPEQVLNLVLQRGPAGQKGDKGDTGPATTLVIGTVGTGDTASATLTGSAPDQTLSLVLPRGDKGDQGDQGDRGPAGSGIETSETAGVFPVHPDEGEDFEVHAFAPDGTPSPGAQTALDALQDALDGLQTLVDAKAATSDVTALETTVSALQTAITALQTATADTGWQDITVNEGFTAQTGNAPQVRKIGNAMFFRGGISGTGLEADSSYQVMVLDTQFRPSRWVYGISTSSSAAATGSAVVASNGNVQIRTVGTVGSYYMLDPVVYTI